MFWFKIKNNKLYIRQVKWIWWIKNKLKVKYEVDYQIILNCRDKKKGLKIILLKINKK